MAPGWKLLAVLMLLLAVASGGYFKGRIDNEAKHTEQSLEETQEARRIEQKRAAFQQETLNEKDASLRAVNGRLADALERLRDRPERLPEAALAACKGSSGRELSGGDAAFLERFAARAEALRRELKAAQDREHGEVTPPLE